jgi:hypothetical protein
MYCTGLASALFSSSESEPSPSFSVSSPSFSDSEPSLDSSPPEKSSFDSSELENSELFADEIWSLFSSIG